MAPREPVGPKAVLAAVSSKATRVCPCSWRKVRQEILDKQHKKQLIPYHCAGCGRLHPRVKGNKDQGNLVLPFPVV